MNYKTYAEARIANPDSEIVTTGKNWDYEKETIGTFEVRVFDDGAHIISNEAWVICNPADYCSSLKEFLNAGFKLAKGDYLINVWGNVGVAAGAADDNLLDGCDHKRFILSASALNGGCKIPSKAEQWTVYNNTLPLCELTDGQAAMLFNAWRGGEVRQALNNSGFCDLPAKATPWFESLVYRIRSKSERELFIDAAVSCLSTSSAVTPQQMTIAACQMFDSGDFKYIDSTQHFGENI